MFNIAYGEMHEYLAWKRKASWNSFDNGVHGFMVLFGNTKDGLSQLVLFGKLIENLFYKNEVENLITLWKLDYLRLFWNYLDID